MVARSEDELLFVVTILCPVQPDPFERYNELLLLAYANWPSLVAVAGKADGEAYLDIPTDSDNCSLTQLVPFHFTISPAVAEVTVTLLRSPKLPAVFELTTPLPSMDNPVPILIPPKSVAVAAGNK